MNIRTKLTLRFILIAAVIIGVSLALIYLSSSNYRRTDFYSRLMSKANNTAKLFIDVDEVDAALLMKIEQDNPVSLPNESIVIYNSRDSLLFSTDEAGILKVDTAKLSQIRLEEELRWELDGHEILGFVYKGKDDFVVVAGAHDIYGTKRLQNLAYTLLIVFGSSTVVISAAAWIYAGKALEPIAKVVKQVDEISITSLDRRVDEGNGQDEIAKLAQTFNNMLSRLETSFLTQKNFISNASHELRTPLTSITGQLEVTLLNPRSAEDYQQVILSILEDIKSLNALSNKLLLLAQSSSEEREQSMTPVRIDELLWQAKDDLMRHSPTFTVNIDLDENLDDETKLTIKGDEQLLRTAVINLMENGCKYSADKSVRVFIQGSRFGISLVFTDKGVGIPQSDIPNIFEPFYRGTNTKSIRGHGIGLPMVRGIVKAHGGTIQLTSVEGKGTVVTIHFPIV